MNAKELGLIIIIVFLNLIGCGEKKVASTWFEGNINIDGSREDWGNIFIYLEDEKIAVGLYNSVSDLYICLVSNDREIIVQFLRQGFTIWFDPKGGKKETMGIKYPLAVRPAGISNRENRGQSVRGMNDIETQVNQLKVSQHSMDIMGPNEEMVDRIFRHNTYGVELELGFFDGNFVYELKIPLEPSTTSPYAINTSLGETIGIGFKTNKIDLDNIRNQMRRGGRGSGGRRGGMSGGGMRGGGMRGGGSGGPQMPEPIEFWLQVTLADKE